MIIKSRYHLMQQDQIRQAMNLVKFFTPVCIATSTFVLLGCQPDEPQPRVEAVPVEQLSAKDFVTDVENELIVDVEKNSRIAWIQANFITEDTQQLAAESSEKLSAKLAQFAQDSKQYLNTEMDDTTARKLTFITHMMTLPAPLDPKKNKRLSQITTELESIYGQGKYCQNGECQNLLELSRTIETSRDPNTLLEAWQGWRTVSPVMRDKYQEMVSLANEGTKELDQPDVGTFWRSQYDMSPEELLTMVEGLWQDVKPLYEALHCHVRDQLNQQYGDDIVAKEGPIPAHVLGNMWAQSWGNIYPLVAPDDADPGYDLTERLRTKQYTEIEMMRTGERFFTSLGFDALPDTFWSRSLFVKPADREVVCHASAWTIDHKEDVRIKMCTQINADDFNTVHHELGHIFYDLAYNQQPLLFQNGANDGFHEAIGDTIALSIVPDYLKTIGLIDQIPDESKDIGLLLKRALDKVAFLPFGLLIDKWRWQVFSGEIAPENYNQGWWQLREQYQGIKPPVERSEADFDAGAKYHIPANTPYLRYFLAHVLQFQFHQALCQAAGYEGPLHRCTIYNQPKAGEKLKAMLAMGASKPWPDALAAVTGSRTMSAQPLLDYFAPLKTWLDEQNAGRQCGWTPEPVTPATETTIDNPVVATQSTDH